MINKLKRKFIIITMSVLTAFVFVIVAVINVINYVEINHQIDRTIDLIQENYGKMPDHNFFPNDNQNSPKREESIMRMRYFTVSFNNGDVSDVTLDKMITLDEEEAKKSQ